MSDLTWAGKLLTDFGVLGLMVFAFYLLYRLVDKWAARFLEVQVGQAKAMSDQAAAVTGLATAVKDGQAGQQDIFLTMNLVADRIDRHGKLLEKIEENCRRRGACA
jgi:hypothetical protein